MEERKTEEEMALIETSLTKRLGIQHPVILAGMNKVANPRLAAAVTNAGGLGMIGGAMFTPRVLSLTIRNTIRLLNDPENGQFGIDLLIPKIGGSARKTNYDYTKGKLKELINIICEHKKNIALFVCAVGVPPKWAVDQLHDSQILCMNMVGHPKHVIKATQVGMDLICAQGGEGGGHTGQVATSILLPACADLCARFRSPLTGGPVELVAAGGISDGRGLAMALAMGAKAVWVGTRFVACEESGASLAHKEAVVRATVDDTCRTLIYSGRPMRVISNDYQKDWHNNRKEEMSKLLNKGVVPWTVDEEEWQQKTVAEKEGQFSPFLHLSGQVAGNIQSVESARDIIQDMVGNASRIIRGNYACLVKSKL